MVSGGPQRKSAGIKHSPYVIYDNFCKATKAHYQIDLIVKIYYNQNKHLTLDEAYKDLRHDSHDLPNSRDENVITLIDSIHNVQVSLTKDFELEMETIQSRIKDLRDQAEEDLLTFLRLK